MSYRPSARLQPDTTGNEQTEAMPIWAFVHRLTPSRWTSISLQPRCQLFRRSSPALCFCSSKENVENWTALCSRHLSALVHPAFSPARTHYVFFTHLSDLPSPGFGFSTKGQHLFNGGPSNLPESDVFYDRSDGRRVRPFDDSASLDFPTMQLAY